MQTCITRQVGVTVGCLPLHLLARFVIKEIPFFFEILPEVNEEASDQ